MPDEGVIFRGSLQQANTARPWHAMTIIPHRLDPMMSTRFLPLTTTQTTHTASCRRRRQAGLMIRPAACTPPAACCVLRAGVLQCNTWCRVQDLGPWLYVACGPGRIIQMQLRLDRGLSIISLVVGRFASQKFYKFGLSNLDIHGSAYQARCVSSDRQHQPSISGQAQADSDATICRTLNLKRPSLNDDNKSSASI